MVLQNKNNNIIKMEIDYNTSPTHRDFILCSYVFLYFFLSVRVKNNKSKFNVLKIHLNIII